MFFRSLEDHEISRQIAGMLNEYSDLQKKRYGPEIRQGKTDYVVETHGRLVIGAIGIYKVSSSLSEIKHLVVRPQWRRKKIGKFLLQQAAAKVRTPLMYATVRKDNMASLFLFEKTGFSREQEYNSGRHTVVLLTRTSPSWKLISSSKPTLSNAPRWEEVSTISG